MFSESRLPLVIWAVKYVLVEFNSFFITSTKYHFPIIVNIIFPALPTRKEQTHICCVISPFLLSTTWPNVYHSMWLFEKIEWFVNLSIRMSVMHNNFFVQLLRACTPKPSLLHLTQSLTICLICIYNNALVHLLCSKINPG